MSKYECVKEFKIPKVDENHSITDEFETIKVGTIWEFEEAEFFHVAGKDGIRLTRDVDDLNSQWIEIYQDHLDDYFVKVN